VHEKRYNVDVNTFVLYAHTTATPELI